MNDPIERDEQIVNLLDMMRKRAEGAPPLHRAPEGRPHRHYSDADTCSHGERLDVGWLELGQEAETAQQLLDFAGIHDGNPQGRGDVDWRVAEAVLRLHEAEGRLEAIAAAHARETGPAGTVGDFCIECEMRWPCPTQAWASGERSIIDRWDPADEEET